jgi:hypothetical protein
MCAQEDEYLLLDEAFVELPPEEELQAAVDESMAVGPFNSTAWLGCFYAEGALLDGDVVGVLDDVESPEACCRACRQLGSAQCSVWNYCANPDGCRYADLQRTVDLQRGQCELRWQYLAAEVGWPPGLISKGPEAANFTTGSPIAAGGPQLSGFKRLMGTGLFGQPGYPCPGSLQVATAECALALNATELGQYCLNDPLCTAILYKPAGNFNLSKPFGIFRHAEGSNLSMAVRSPSGVVYYREDVPTTTGTSSSGGGGLSAGAIAGKCHFAKGFAAESNAG